MSTIADSPSPINQINWNDQVKVGHGHGATGAFHRAIKVAEKLLCTGQWNGRGLIVIHNAYDAHRELAFRGMVMGEDFEYADDSTYQGSGPVEMTNVVARQTEPEAEEVLRALLDYLSPGTLARMAHDMRQGGYEVFGGWGVDHWTTEYEVAYRRIMVLGEQLIDGDWFEEMVLEVGL